MTLDAGNTSRETILALQEQHGADTLATIQGNAGLAYDLIAQDGNCPCAVERHCASAGANPARQLFVPAVMLSI